MRRSGQYLLEDLHEGKKNVPDVANTFIHITFTIIKAVSLQFEATL